MLKLIILTCSFLILSSCSLPKKNYSNIATNSGAFSRQENALWDSFIVPYVKNTNFNNIIELYDFCTYMLIPMNAAFLYQKHEGMTLFKDHVNTFLTPSIKNNYISLSKSINKIQYLFLLSEYCKLAQIYNNNTNDSQFLIPELITFIESELSQWWNDPAWQWDTSPFPNLKSRIDWKLTASPELHNFYKKWILDETFYVFGIAGNLKFITRYSSQTLDQGLLNDILETAQREIGRAYV